MLIKILSRYKRVFLLVLVAIFVTGCVDAGQEQSVKSGDIVQLKGSVWWEDERSSYKWEQVSGPKVELVNDTTLSPSFKAPYVEKKSYLKFKFTVTWKYSCWCDTWVETYYDDVTIIVKPNRKDEPVPPILEMIPTQEVMDDSNLTIALNAKDANGDKLYYSAVASKDIVDLKIDGNKLKIFPKENYSGDTNITVTVSDGNFSDKKTFLLHVWKTHFLKYMQWLKDDAGYPNDNYSKSTYYRRDIKLIDMNNDGLVDRVTNLENGSTGLYVAYNNGNGFNKPEILLSENVRLEGYRNRNDYSLQDINGDGLPDLLFCNRRTTKFYVFINQKNRFSEYKLWDQEPRKYREYNQNCLRELRDINGDGLLDRVRHNLTIRENGTHHKKYGLFVEFNNGHGFDDIQNLTKGLSKIKYPKITKLVDVNGDGLVDILQYGYTEKDSRLWGREEYYGLYVAINNGHGFNDFKLYSLTSGGREEYYYKTMKLIDMNGDELVDIVNQYGYFGNRYEEGISNYSARKEKGFYVAINNGKKFEDFKLWDPYVEGTKNNYPDSKNFRLIDINGDGLPDRVGHYDVHKREKGLYVKLNNGHGFNDFILWSTNNRGYDPSNIVTNSDRYGVYSDLVDINGDGCVDRVGHYNYNTKEKGVFIALSKECNKLKLLEIDDQNTSEDTPIKIVLNTIGRDAKSLSYDVFASNDLVVTSIDKDILTILPKQNSYGSTVLTITASDGSLSDTQEFKVTISPVNDKPILDSINDQTIDEDTNKIITLQASDVDGDNLTYSAISSDESIVKVSVIDNKLKLLPQANKNGKVAIKATVSDGKLSDTKEFSLTINPIDDAPILKEINPITTNEDTNKTITLKATDIDSKDLVYSAKSLNTNLAEVLVSGDRLTFIPKLNKNGDLDINVTVSADGNSDSKIVKATIKPVNDKPILDSINDQTIDEDTNKIITLQASDVDGDNLTYSAISSDESIVKVSVIDNKLKLLPQANKNGKVAIKATVSDGKLSDTKEFSLTINPVNDAPTAQDKNITVDEDQAVIVDLSNLVSDVDEEDELTTSIKTSPAIGKIVDEEDGTYIYTPNKNQNGSDSFTYIVTDKSGATDEATINITIKPVNDAPILEKIARQTTQEDTPITIDIVASDIDGDKLTYSAIAKDSSLLNLTINKNILTITPKPNKFGSTDITLSANDGNITTKTTFGIDVVSVNDKPILTKPSDITMNENETKSILLSSMDFDGDDLTYSVTSSDTNLLQTTINGSSLELKTFKGKTGSVDVTVVVSDGSLSDTKTFKVDIEAIKEDKPPYLITGYPKNNGFINADFNATKLSYIFGDDNKVESVALYSEDGSLLKKEDGEQITYNLPNKNMQDYYIIATDDMGQKTRVDIRFKVDIVVPTTVAIVKKDVNTALVDLVTDEDATIYYTTDGIEPYPGHPDLHKGVSPIKGIKITKNTLLQFYAVDSVGNQEEVKKETFIFDDLPLFDTQPNIAYDKNTPKVTLTWDKKEGAKSYKIYRVDTKIDKTMLTNNNLAKVQAPKRYYLDTTDTNSYVDKSIEYGLAYSYVVSYVDSNGVESLTSSAVMVETIASEGNLDMQTAINRAYNWLLSNQNQNGTWGVSKEYYIPATAESIKVIKQKYPNTIALKKAAMGLLATRAVNTIHKAQKKVALDNLGVNTDYLTHKLEEIYKVERTLKNGEKDIELYHKDIYTILYINDNIILDKSQYLPYSLLIGSKQDITYTTRTRDTTNKEWNENNETYNSKFVNMFDKVCSTVYNVRAKNDNEKLWQEALKNEFTKELIPILDTIKELNTTAKNEIVDLLSDPTLGLASNLIRLKDNTDLSWDDFKGNLVPSAVEGLNQHIQDRFQPMIVQVRNEKFDIFSWRKHDNKKGLFNISEEEYNREYITEKDQNEDIFITSYMAKIYQIDLTPDDQLHLNGWMRDFDLNVAGNAVEATLIGDDILDTAASLRWLNFNNAIKQKAINFLLAQQELNGSWGNDPYLTSFIIQTLQKVKSEVK